MDTDLAKNKSGTSTHYFAQDMYNSIMDLEKVCRELRDRSKRIGVHVSPSPLVWVA